MLSQVTVASNIRNPYNSMQYMVFGLLTFTNWGKIGNLLVHAIPALILIR